MGEFCRAMQEKEAGPDTLALMKTAIQAHNSYAKMAVAGLGVDRHMQGLKLIEVRRIRLLPLLRTSGGRWLRGLLQSSALGHALPLLRPALLPGHLGPCIQRRLGSEPSRHALTRPAVWDCGQALNIFTLHNDNAFKSQDNT